MKFIFITFALLFSCCSLSFCQTQPSKAPETDWELYSPGAFPEGWILPIDRVVAAYGQVKNLYLVGDFNVTAAGQNRCVLRNKDYPTFRFVVDFPKGILPPKEKMLITRTALQPFLVTSVKPQPNGDINVYLKEIIE